MQRSQVKAPASANPAGHRRRAAIMLAAAALALGVGARPMTARATDPPIHFQQAVNYPVATNPIDVVSAGDFNGDGAVDLATSNSASNNVGILMSNGDGTFRPVVYYPTGGAGTTWIAEGDFNRDGRLDLVTSNVSSNNVSVLLGNGDGTFQAPATYAVGIYPNSVAVADFNGDGKLDLVASNFQSGSVSVLLGNGNGTFQSAVNYSAPSPWFVTAADLGGNGRLDLVTVDQQSPGHVDVLLGNGDGTFQPAVTYAAGNGPTNVVAGDFNGDGKLDLAADNQYSGNVSVLLGNGDGTFQSQVVYPAGNNLSDLVAGDFDRDSHLDLAVLAAGTNTVNILKGNGDGSFQAPVNFGVDFNPQDLATADFNGDGQTDIVTVNESGTASIGFKGSVSVLINDTFPTTATVTGNVQSGNLTEHLYANPAFAVTLDGRDEVVSYQIPLEVNDARGTGAGWNLTITSTQFQSGGHTLASDASAMTAVTTACVLAASCVPPANSIAYPLAVPAGAVAPPPVKWFNAAPLTGMGAMNVTPTINVSIPASTFAGAYHSTITLAVVTGP